MVILLVLYINLYKMDQISCIAQNFLSFIAFEIRNTILISHILLITLLIT